MKAKGFTLIELLVVISIIALLLSILLPALSLAKQQAEYVVCKTKLKTAGLAERLYCNDNNEEFAWSYDYPNPTPGGDRRRLIMPYIDSSYMYTAMNYQQDKQASNSLPYLGYANIGEAMRANKYPFLCPSAQKRMYFQSESAMQSFALNGTILSSYAYGPLSRGTLYKITSTRSASDTMLEIDAGPYFGNGANPNAGYFYGHVSWQHANLPLFFHFGKGDLINLAPNSPYSTQHGRAFVYEGGRTNILFFDGHVKHRRLGEWVMRPQAITPEMTDAGVDDHQWNMFWRGGL